MNLRIVTVGELIDFVKEDDYQQLKQVPITPARALSQYHNPHAEKTDVALIIALDDEGQLLSYFGCLPDRLAADPSVKICWCSCWWTDAEKGKKSTMPVFYKALASWNGQMLFDALPERSIAILERLNFVTFKKMDGVQLSFRFKLAKVLPNRMPILENAKYLLKLGDWCLNGFQALRLKSGKKAFSDIETTTIKTFDEASVCFIEEYNTTELIGRNDAVLNWIINYPWIDNQPNGQGAFSEKYFFSAHAIRFLNRIIQVKKGDEIIAVLFFTFRDGVVRLPYVYFGAKDLSTIGSIVINLLVDWRADTFICFHPTLQDWFRQQKGPFYHRKEISKTIGIPTTLLPHLNTHPQLQDGDGDVVFT